MNHKYLAGALLICGAAAPAFADNPSGPYIGGGYGRFNLHVHNFSDAGQAATTIVNSNDNAWKLFAGYRFSPYFAIEGDYIDLGRPGDRFTATGSDGTYSVHATGFAPTIIGSLPLGPVEVFAEAGYYYYNVKLAVNVASLGSAALDSSHSRSDFLYGAGAGVTVLDHLHLRAEYQRINLTNFNTSDALWLTAGWRF